MFKYFFLLSLPLLALLSGCTIDQAGTVDPSSVNADECAESGGEFCSIDGSSVALELIIKTTSPVTPKSIEGDCNGDALSPLNEFCFDVSGDCNEAGLDLAAIVATADISGAVETVNLGSCKRGRFHVQLRLILNPVDRGILHKVDLELVGKKADGTEVRQPAKAKKTIHILVPQEPL